MGLMRNMLRIVLKAGGLKVINDKPIPSAVMHHQIDVLLDVGANQGQYARKLRELGYRGKIISFEPLPAAHETLLELAKDDPLWTIHPRCAVGSAVGETEINVSKNSYSSSILPIMKTHVDAAANAAYVGKAKVDVITLDSVFSQYCKAGDKIFLKIDTQGFEGEVLKGAMNILPNMAVVQLEMSIVPLYEGQRLYDYFFDFFKERGFFLWALERGFYDPVTGQNLQFDATFVRNDLAQTPLH